MAGLTWAQRRWMTWAGTVLSSGVTLVLFGSAAMKFRGAPDVQSMFTGKLGYPAAALTLLGCIEAACGLLHAVPVTAVWGAVLVTGYLGGAAATHLRIGEPMLPPILIGMLAWAGLALRRSGVRHLFLGSRD